MAEQKTLDTKYIFDKCYVTPYNKKYYRITCIGDTIIIPEHNVVSMYIYKTNLTCKFVLKSNKYDMELDIYFKDSIKTTNDIKSALGVDKNNNKKCCWLMGLASLALMATYGFTFGYMVANVLNARMKLKDRIRSTYSKY